MLADLLRIILAFFLPPLAVATQVGVQASAFWLNLIFWLLSFGGLGLPVLAIMWPVAVIHALYIIITRTVPQCPTPGTLPRGARVIACLSDVSVPSALTLAAA